MIRKRHILVTGSNRSGTTWVGTMLSLAPKIGLVYEPFSYQLKDAKLSKHDCPFVHYLHYVTPSENEIAKKYINCRLSKRPISWKKEFNESKTARRFLGATCRYLHAWINSFQRIERFVIKDPIALMSAEWMAKEFQCHVLVMIRHPAAYVSSIKRLGWRTNPKKLLEQKELVEAYLSPLKEEIKTFSSENIVEEACLCWKIYHFVISIYQKKNLGWLFVRHEDISRDPINKFKYLYDQFSLPFSEDVVNSIKESSKAGNPVDPGDKVHMLQRDSKRNITRWKRELTKAEIEIIYDKTADIAVNYYSLESWL